MAFLQVGGEERLAKRALDGVEESRARGWRDGIDATESKTDETVIVGVLEELRRNGGRSLNRLRCSSDLACGNVNRLGR